MRKILFAHFYLIIQFFSFSRVKQYKFFLLAVCGVLVYPCTNPNSPTSDFNQLKLGLCIASCDQNRGSQHNRVGNALLEGIMLGFQHPGTFRHAMFMTPSVFRKFVSLKVLLKDVGPISHLSEKNCPSQAHSETMQEHQSAYNIPAKPPSRTSKCVG